MFLQASQYSLDVSQVVNEIFATTSLNSISTGFLALGGLAAVIYFAKIASEFAVGGKVQYVKLGPLIVYALLVANWTTLNSQLDSGLKNMQTVFQSATPENSQSTVQYQNLMKKFGVIPADGTANPQGAGEPPKPPISGIGDSGTFSVLSGISDKFDQIMLIINHPEILIMKLTMVTMYLFNMAIVVLFNAFTYLWINLLRIGGPLALSLYFFPRMAGSFSNWIKAYISVYLWIPVGSIMIYVSDQIFIKIVSNLTVQDTYFSAVTTGTAVISTDTMYNMALIAIAAVATTFLKCILLTKVPSIIGYWVGGGGTGDMFGASAAAGMMGVQGVTKVASTGATAVTGGASGVATGVAGSLKG